MKKIMFISLAAIVCFGLCVTAQDNVKPEDRAPIAKDQSEQKILDVLEQMNAHERRGMMNVDYIDGRVLRMLTESTNAKTVVEIGTSNGFSGIWFCLALRKTSGRLITYDIDKGRFDLATKNFKRAGVSDMVTQVFGDAHEKVKNIEGSIDILFLDADKEGYIDYLDQLLGKVKPGGLIIAHNTVNLRGAMLDYINKITSNPDLETVFLRKDGQGMSVTMKKR